MTPCSDYGCGCGRLADALWRAERERAPIAPLTDAHPGLTVADAYAIQTHNVARRVAAGAVVRGRKVGLHVAAARSSCSASTSPTSACCSTTCSSTTATRCRSPSWSQPRVEAEMAFVLAARPRRPGRHHGRRARPPSAGVLPALEVVDSRIADWRSPASPTPSPTTPRAARVVLGRTHHARRGARPAAARGAALPQRRPDRQRRRRGRARQPGPLRRRGWPTSSAGFGERAAPRRHRAAGGAAPDGAGPPRRRFSGRVRPPRHRHACGSRAP